MAHLTSPDLLSIDARVGDIAAGAVLCAKHLSQFARDAKEHQPAHFAGRLDEARRSRPNVKIVYDYKTTAYLGFLDEKRSCCPSVGRHHRAPGEGRLRSARPFLLLN